MRPQLAMAALFFLVIGSSLLLLRAKPGTVGAPVRVTENGIPAPEQAEAPATVPLAAPPPVAAAPSIAAAPTAAPASADEAAADGQLALAEARGREEVSKDAAKEAKGAKEKDREASKSDKADRESAQLALSDARSVRDTSGCAAAVSKFDEVGTRFPGTGSAADAMWDAAACHKSMGELDKARQLYLALKSIDSYRERAEQELTTESNVGSAQNQMAARAPKAAARPAAASAPPAAAKRPASFGSGAKATAAPKRAVDAAY
jgi:hypothetical protein